VTGRWRPLPDSPAPEVAYLVELLRQLKDRSGLSLAALAARTAYSKSSWERYLNGAALPPRDAVAALCRLAGEPVDRLLALWEPAQARWSRRADEAESAAAEPETAVVAPVAARHHTRLWAGVAAGISCLVALLAVAGPFGPVSRGDGPTPVPVTVGCRATGCAGRDAYDQACAIDAATDAELWIGGTHLELRISPRCGAAWARLSRSAVGDRLLVVDRDGHVQAATVADPAATAQYVASPMLPAARPAQVQACLQRAEARQCTPWK
jgi:transcriptional regulator with XRE-family HTH domain